MASRVYILSYSVQAACLKLGISISPISSSQPCSNNNNNKIFFRGFKNKINNNNKSIIIIKNLKK